MNRSKWLITVASWEERFLLGMGEVLKEHTVSDSLLFYYSEYKKWTKANRKKTLSWFQEYGVHYTEVEISFGDPVRSWHILHDRIVTQAVKGDALVDCTTMPRDTLWTCLKMLQKTRTVVDYVYRLPRSYDLEWLSREPSRPALVYKLSGIATLGRPTCLIVTTGFDPERTRQLMWYYEAPVICLGFQSGTQFGNQDQNIGRHRAALKEEYGEFDVGEFTVDAFSRDHGESAIAAQIEKYSATHNIVMTSLGPKLGAVALFRLHSKFPETALSYTHCREFNRDYSKGISESYWGVIKE